MAAAWRPIELSVTKHAGLVEMARALPAKAPETRPGSAAATNESRRPERTPRSEEDLWPSLAGFGGNTSFG